MARRAMISYRHGTNVRTRGARLWILRQALKALSIGAPRLAERLVERLFFTPGTYAVSAEEQLQLDMGEPIQFRIHGRRICGWRWGNGPGVLLFHGWNGRGIQFHRFIDPLVRAGYTAIAIDGPAHGASEGRSTSYFEYTDTVRALIEPARGLRIHGIVAHSLGASAVVNGLAHQKAALKTVLLAPALKLREMLFNGLDQHGIPRRTYENIIAAYEARFGYNFELDDPHRHLGELCSPVLVIHDEEDPVVAYGDSRALCLRFDRMTLLTTRGLGHRNIMTDPVVVDAAVSHLLEHRESAFRDGRLRCPPPRVNINT